MKKQIDPRAIRRLVFALENFVKRCERKLNLGETLTPAEIEKLTELAEIEKQYADFEKRGYSIPALRALDASK